MVIFDVNCCSARSPQIRAALLAAAVVCLPLSAAAQDGGTDAGPGSTDAGPGTTDAGPGNTDAGPGNNTDAGPGNNNDAGPGNNNDAGPGNVDAGNVDAGPGAPLVECDPMNFTFRCEGDDVIVCNQQTTPPSELAIDCPTLYDDPDNPDDLGGLAANTVCGNAGCVETGADPDCALLTEPTCVGSTDGLCQLINFGSPANLGSLVFCEDGLSCAVNVEGLPVGGAAPEPEFVNRCYPSFGTCAVGQRGGPCVEINAPGDTMTYCSDIRGPDDENFGVIEDLSGFRCTNFNGGACTENATGQSACTFQDNFCANVVGGLYACDHDRSGEISGACDYGIELPAPWGEGADTGSGSCVGIEAPCTPTEIEADFVPECNGDFLITECNQFVNQGYGYDCGRVEGATCGMDRNGDASCVVQAGGPCSNTLPFACGEGLFCNGAGQCQFQSGDGDTGDGDGDGDNGDGDGDGTDAGPGGDGMMMCGGGNAQAAPVNSGAGFGAMAFALLLGALVRRRRD